MLSCGALIDRLAPSCPVTVATVFTGSPERPDATPLGRLFQRRWGMGVDPMTGRRAEDAAALTLLRASFRHLGGMDCIYRTDAAGAALYPSVEAVVQARPEPELDELLQGQLRRLVADLAPTRVYAPVGIGRHADHLAVRRAVGALLERGLLSPDTTAYWEDVPYRCYGSDASWRAELCRSLTGSVLRLPGGRRKRAAVEEYRSQVGMLWWTEEAREECLGGELEDGQLFVCEGLWASRALSVAALLEPAEASARPGEQGRRCG